MTKLEIINLGLIRIGEQPLNSLTDGTVTAAKVNRLWEPVYDSVLESGPKDGWKCATVRTSVAVDGTAPEHGYDYRYALPSNPFCFRPVLVEADGSPLSDWTVEGRYILTDEEAEEIDLTYIGRVDTSLLPPSLASVVHLTLALYMCYDTSKTGQMIQDIKQELKEAWREARYQNGLNKKRSESNNDVVDRTD